MSTTAAPDAVRPRARSRTGSVRVLLLLLLAVGGAVVLSLMIGSRLVPPADVVSALLRDDDSETTTLVRELRVPRTLIGLLVGLGLGAAGALMQGHTRNPLADPGLLGISAGSAFAVVLGIFVFGVTTTIGYAWFALVGAGLAAVVVFAIGSTRGGPDPLSLVLAGSAVSALLFALTQGIVLRDLETLDDYRFWVVGSVQGRQLEVFWQVLPFMVVGLVLAAVGAASLNLLQLGDDVARSLGLNPVLHKALGIAAVMLLAGGATAAAGPIVFVGLVVPHVARLLTGPDFRWLLPYSALLGALLVMLTDVVGRVVAPPGELQVGIVMALVGGPVFVLLVRRMRMVGL